MLESYEINSLEQLRALADLLRVQILDLLQEHPMTVTQVAAMLELAPAKVHYHVRELERVGLLRLVETREKGGILEKYYQPIARDISIAKALFLTIQPDESLAATSAWFDQLKEGFQKAFRAELEQKVVQPNLGLGLSHIYVTAAEQKELVRHIIELLKPYEKRRNIAGEEKMVNALICYPLMASAPTQTPHDAVMMDATWTVGVAHFSRADLERVRAEGNRLRIKVIGICQFADDIDVDLADAAIEQLSLIGKLQAPPRLQEVLQSKRH